MVSKMYCPKCGKDTLIKNRFCPGCGMELESVASLISSDNKSPETELRNVTGLGQVMAGALVALMSLFVCGLATIPHLANYLLFLSIWGLLVGMSAITIGTGIVKLIRTGFLKELKEREMKARLAQMEQKRRVVEISAGETSALPSLSDTKSAPPPVIEATTRNLDHNTAETK